MKNRISHWGQNPENLLFGLEQEYFVFSNGNPPTLTQMADMLNDFASDFQFTVRKKSEANFPLSVNRDTYDGYIAVKNDFCTHILEVSFPPVHELSKLEGLFGDVWGKLEDKLRKYGMSIQNVGSLSSSPENTIFVPHERLKWMESRQKPKQVYGLWHRYFTTLMCSTQVHLNIQSEVFFRSLKSYYDLEKIVILLFSTSKRMIGKEYFCCRPLAWKDNLSKEYQANAIPAVIPKSKSEYETFISGSVGFVRDYTYIAPRPFGTVEFRAACAQPDFDRVRKLIVTRMLISTIVEVSGWIPNDSLEIERSFYRLCENGRIDQEFLNKLIASIKNVVKLIPSGMRTTANQLIEEIHDYTK